MDNNVIVPVNLMRACNLYNVGHENNVNCLIIAVYAIAIHLHSIENKSKNMKMNDFIIVSTSQLTINNII